MTTSPSSSHAHDAASELLGAYALHSLDTDEAAAVEAHLAECYRCQEELAQYHEAAAMLGNAGNDAPAELWDRISAGLTRPPAAGPTPPPRLTRVASPGSPTRRARRLSPRVVVATLAAAAAVAIAVLSVQVGHLDHRVSQLSSAPEATRALTDPHAQHVTLTSTTRNETVASLVILPSGTAYLTDHHLPALPTSETYQLWSMIPGRTVSVALLGRRPTTVALTLNAAAPTRAYAITVEPAGGAVAPTKAPVAEGVV